MRAATDRYRDVLFFRPGWHGEPIVRRAWPGLGVRHAEVEVYDDVVMVAAFRSETAPIVPFGGRFRERPRHRPGSMLIKCVRDNVQVPTPIRSSPRRRW